MTEKKDIDIYDKIKLIRTYSDYEESELGPSWRTLCDAFTNRIYYSEKLSESIENEINELYEDLITNWKLSEKKETEVRTFCELEYLGD